MDGDGKGIVVIASPAAPLLQPVLHELSHRQINTTLITRATSIKFAVKSHNHVQNENSHDHDHAQVHHITTTFEPSSLVPHLKSQTTVITILTGPDVHLTPKIITAAQEAGVKRFIPSEYCLDTSISPLCELLPPYRLRHDFQDILKRQGSLEWTAIYGGCVLEEAMKPEGVLGVDVVWGSVSAFGGRELGGEKEVVLSTYSDIAKGIVATALLGEEEWKSIQGDAMYISSHVSNLEEIVGVVQALEQAEGRDREYDWYEAVGELARKEAAERMKLGYFDGGVALLLKIAIWDGGFDAFAGWKRDGGKNNEILGLERTRSLEETLAGVVADVREGKDGNDCGC